MYFLLALNARSKEDHVQLNLTLTIIKLGANPTAEAQMIILDMCD